jgi:hypothetical protein
MAVNGINAFDGGAGRVNGRLASPGARLGWWGMPEAAKIGGVTAGLDDTGGGKEG